MKATMKLSTLILSTMLLLAGCATGYKESMKDYRQSEPLRYEERTAELLQEDKPSTPSISAEEVPSLQAMKDEISPRDKFTQIAAEFFQLSPDEFQSLSDRLDDSEKLNEHLGNELTFRDLAIALSRHNPSVEAARSQWQATLHQYSQAEFLDSLIAEYRSFTRYLNVESGEPLNKEMTKKFFPFPSAISLKGELVRQQVRLAELEWQKKLRDVVVKTGSAFFKYQYLVRAEQTAEENVALVENLLGVVEQRYRSGDASQPDLLRVQTELERQRNMLQDIRSQERGVIARINASLNRASDAPLGPPDDSDMDEVPPGLETLVQESLQHRQEVLLQQTRAKRTETSIRMGEVMNRPLAGQGYSRFERGMMPEASAGQSRASYGLAEKENELPDYARSEAFLSEMRERLDAHKSMVRQVNAHTRGMAEDLFRAVDVTRREVDLLREIVLPQDRSAYETTLTNYTSGRASFIDLLDAERALINSRLELHQARREQNLAILRLANVRGTLSISP